MFTILMRLITLETWDMWFKTSIILQTAKSVSQRKFSLILLIENVIVSLQSCKWLLLSCASVLWMSVICPQYLSEVIANKDLYVSRGGAAAVARRFRRLSCLPLALETSTLLSRQNVSSLPFLITCQTYDNCNFLMFLRRLRCSPAISSMLSLLFVLVHDIRNSILQRPVSIASSCGSVLLLRARIRAVRLTIRNAERISSLRWLPGFCSIAGSFHLCRPFWDYTSGIDCISKFA